MKIRDGFARLNGDSTEYEIPNEIEIIAEDGRALFSISVRKDGYSIDVRTNDVIKVNGVLYAEQFTIRPIVSNRIEISRIEYK